MYNYSENWYNDSIKWYVSDDYLNAELPLFTKVYTVFTAEIPETLEYNTLAELQSGKFSYLQATAYSVERSSVNEIILTCRYPLGSPTVNSIALVSEYNNSAILLAKISRDTSAPIIVPNGLDRVFKMNLPYKIVGNEKVYPNVSLRLKRYASSPIGEELVTTGEHHHNVDWGGVNNRDSIPVLSQSRGRYVASADYNKQDGFPRDPEKTSKVYNESGILDSTVASITGRFTSPSGADISDTSIPEDLSRIISTDAIKNLLANVMEEYLMATNSIQILGHEIDRITANNPVETDDYDNTNLLYVTRTDATNTRALKAVRMNTFRDWLVKNFSYTTVSECETTACVNLVSSTKNVTVNLQKTSQVALVSNVNSVSSSINSGITVSSKTGSVSVSLYPRETALIMKDSSGTYSGFKIGSTDLLRNVLNGTYGFSKVAFSSTAGSKPSTTEVDNITTDSNGKVSVSFRGNTAISGTFKATGKTTLEDELEVKKKASIGTSLTAASSALAVTGKASVSGTFEGSSTGKFADKLTVSSNGMDITGNSKVTGTFEGSSTGKFADKLTVSSNGIDVTGNSKVTGTFEGTSTGTFGDTLTVSSGGADITGNSSVTGTFEGTSTAKFADKLTVSSNGIDVTGNSKVSGTFNTTDKLTVADNGLTITKGGLTVTAGGATVTAGGLTISAGGASIVGDSSVTGTFGVTSTSTFGGAVTVSSGGLTASGQTIAAGSISAGSSTFSGNVSVSYSGSSTTITNAKVTSAEGNFTSVTGLSSLELGSLTVTGTISAKKVNSTDGFFIS